MASCFKSCSERLYLGEVKAVYIIPWELIKGPDSHKLSLYIPSILSVLSGGLLGRTGVLGSLDYRISGWYITFFCKWSLVHLLPCFQKDYWDRCK